MENEDGRWLRGSVQVLDPALQGKTSLVDKPVRSVGVVQDLHRAGVTQYCPSSSSAGK